MKFPPIDRTSGGWWRHKTYEKGIKVKITKKQMESLLNKINSKINEAEICMGHHFDYAIEKPYRLYRRGKNRCKYCGVKL